MPAAMIALTTLIVSKDLLRIENYLKLGFIVPILGTNIFCMFYNFFHNQV